MTERYAPRQKEKEIVGRPLGVLACASGRIEKGEAVAWTGEIRDGLMVVAPPRKKK